MTFHTDHPREHRLAEARSFAGYRSAHFARSTGALIVVLDDHVSGYESDPDVGRWATLCDDHDRLIFHSTLALARSHAAAPEGWCGVCAGTETEDQS